MAISRIPGYSFLADLDRQGVDLQFTTNGSTLAYLDFANFRLGINTVPQYPLDVFGNVRLSNVYISANSISSDTGSLNFGSNANVKIFGGLSNYVIYTDGNGNLSWDSVLNLVGADSFIGNNISMGTNTSGTLISNAVSLTTATTVTDGIAQLNQVLGKLVPPSPPAFPNSTTLTINGLTAYRMCNFTQTDNTINFRNVAGGTTVSSVLRTGSYTTNTIANVGPGSSGLVSVFLNGNSAGSTTLTGSSNGTYGNLVIANNRDYHDIVANVAAGFWYSFSVNASGSVPAGWNDANIRHAGVPANTNTVGWYYDNSAPGTPLFFTPNIYISSASLTYSSTIPHYNSSTTANIGFNVNRLSGDMYPTTDTFVTGTAGGAFAVPASRTYAQANVTTPLARNLYTSSGNATVYTTSAIVSGFGSSSTGPSVSVSNSYNTGTQAFSPGNIVLYKTGTATNIEETSIPVTSVGTGSGNAYRILNPGSTDTPVYTGSEAAFNSQTSTLQTYDATVVAAVMKHDVTNYSTGYWPPGPNLSTGRTGSQYFTLKFIRTVVSKFDIVYTGNIAGLWVSLPGSTIDTTSTLNGWLDMSTAYAGSGIPGAGVGGNGSNGCALSGVAVLNTAQTAKAVTATFGTVSSSSTATNEIYVRIEFTSGQSLTALSIAAASH
jgi:hypothetical protein